MTRKVKRFIKDFVVMLVILAVTVTSVPFSCTKVSAASSSGSSVAFKSADHKKICVGESYSFDLVNKQPGAKYAWSSSKKSVAKVNNKGVVTGVATGTATITCKVTNQKKSTILKATVSVEKASKKGTDKVKSNGKVDFKSANYRKLRVGESYNFNLINKQSGAKYIWSSSKKSVARVNNKGVVKAVAVGTATITCKIKKGNKNTTLKAKVYVQKASKKPAKSIKITNKITTMAPGEVYDFNRSYSPKKASDSVNWTSSNTAVATVDKNGVVTAKSNGTVVIKVTTVNKKVSDQVAITVSDNVQVSSQKDMERLLKAKKVKTITIKTSEKMNFNIPKGNYLNKKLIVNAPNATIKNKGAFESIEIQACANFIVDREGITVKFMVLGTTKITVNKPCDIQFDGDTKLTQNVVVKAKNVQLHTKLPLNLEANEMVKIELQSEEAANTIFKVPNEQSIPEVQGKGTIHGTAGTKAWSVSAEGKKEEVTPTASVAPTPSTTSVPSTTPTPEVNPTMPAPTPSAPVVESGLDSDGRVVANFGSPVVDGEIDDIWKQARPVSAKINSGDTTTAASFKTLWDDNAIFFLAEVKDSDLSAEAANVYERDSVEFFLDELNDKSKDYGADDLQFRVNYLNHKSGDHGDLVRFSTNAKVVEGGYVIEGRIAFTEKPENGKVMGFDMQVNDAKEGSRIATMSVFDTTGTAYADTTKFGEILLTGKETGSVSGVNPYDLIALVDSAKEIELARYSNGNDVQKLMDQAETLIADKTVTQEQIDELYSKLNAAIKALKHSNESFDEKECRQVPAEYKAISAKQGTIERLDYETSTYDENPKDIEKYLNVYLPYGYDQNDTSKKYNVLYLIHGMSEDQNTVFGGPGQNKELKRIVDNMIANGKLEPMIIVTPTWQVEGKDDMFSLVKNFHTELLQDILPLIEGRYNTYAKTTSAEDLIAARDHRAFGGFSMGSGCTWYNYIYGIDYFKYYLPISLYCLQDVSEMGYSGTSDEQMAQYLADVATKAGYTKDDINIFCATGTDDMAYDGMVSQIDAMKKLDNIFSYSADLRKGNFYFLKLEGGTHIWNCVNRYLYNMLPDLFQSSWSDENGLDESGRVVAQFGSPVVDGKVDGIWSQAKSVTPQYNTSTDGTKATFKTMWDDNALYVLAQVKDKNMTVESGTPYMQDSMEIFFDENNDKTQEFGTDDLQFRVNYENGKTADKGDILRFYTQTSTTEDGYIIEARIELKNKPVNDKVLGIDLQINDGKGTERVGTLNVFDSTGGAWNDTSLFGNVVLKGKTDSSVTGINPYKLLSLIDAAKKVELSDYKNGDILTAAITTAEVALEKSGITQEEIDEQYAAVDIAMKSLVFTEDAENIKRYVSVPTEYKAENEKAGNIVSLTYDAPNTKGGIDEKKVNVYLPYGYDASNTEKKYNVLYLMHGGGENTDTIFGGEGESRELKRIIDNMVANGEIDPLIVVTPSFYGGTDDVATFYTELMDIVVPKIETTYHTYAESGSLADLKATRDHRAFGGFSMGSVCTWYVYANCLDYFKYYLPLSGDCWKYGQGAGSSMSKETAEFLEQAAKDAGYGPDDFYLFCATGSEDIAFPNLNPQIEEMKKLTDTFKYSADTTKGNFYFIVADGGTHAWNFINQYIYDILPDLFK